MKWMGTSPPTTLGKTGRYGWISRPTGLIHVVQSAYLRLTVIRELVEASNKTCGGIEALAHSKGYGAGLLFGKLSNTNHWLIGTKPAILCVN
jgi:hypothetical protein